MTDLHPLGRHVEHDPRSRDYPFEVAAATPLRKTLWRRYGRVLDQGQLGSCTGNAIVGALNTLPLRKTGAAALTEKDAVSIYGSATAIDSIPGQYPPTDTGSSGLAVCKSAGARPDQRLPARLHARPGAPGAHGRARYHRRTVVRRLRHS